MLSLITTALVATTLAFTASCVRVLEERFPRLILHLDSDNPDQQSGTQYGGRLHWGWDGQNPAVKETRAIATAVIFDMPPGPLQQSQFCTLDFALSGSLHELECIEDWGTPSSYGGEQSQMAPALCSFRLVRLPRAIAETDTYRSVDRMIWETDGMAVLEASVGWVHLNGTAFEFQAVPFPCGMNNAVTESILVLPDETGPNPRSRWNLTWFQLEVPSGHNGITLRMWG